MSVPALKKNYYLIHAPDIPNAQRAKHIAAHMATSAPLVQSGYIVAGGGFLPQTAHSSDADALAKISGSFILVQADTAEQAWETLRKDAFWESGEVWDREKVTVTPVYVGVPKVE
ncbi:hypothetical protein K466DRAFT_495826 [Polyporus arcularius HHB13444]|uniref:YCII-related domain-containing protein n=1 Tax=Polyporus arcularius HHB13444 TaxID=1314778 RepID=A0A5C3P5C5_9APHY|nr:hypothetical protein K466DRAFT_495826 [Polyporus arcularius HHB13444]